MTSQNAPAVLTVKEVAAVLRIRQGRVYELIDRGVIPAVRLGRTIRVPRVALEEMLTRWRKEGSA